MNCNEVKNLIIDRIDDNLDSKLARQVDEHLAVCQSCQEEYIQTGNLLQSMSGIIDEQPPESLKEDFRALLQKETKKMAGEEKDDKITFINRKRIFATLKYAAAILIIFTVGYVMGNISSSKTNDDAEVAALKQEIESLKENTYLMSLNKPTASERLKVVNTVSKSNLEDLSLINALVNTLNTDDNANVRLAAAYALAKFPNNEYVRTSLISSLELQTEPIVQISLIGILIDFKDNRAKPAIEKLIENEKVLPEVKQQALIGLSVFV